MVGSPSSSRLVQLPLNILHRVVSGSRMPRTFCLARSLQDDQKTGCSPGKTPKMRASFYIRSCLSNVAVTFPGTHSHTVDKHFLNKMLGKKWSSWFRFLTRRIFYWKCQFYVLWVELCFWLEFSLMKIQAFSDQQNNKRCYTYIVVFFPWWMLLKVSLDLVIVV